MALFLVKQTPNISVYSLGIGNYCSLKIRCYPCA